MNQPALPPEIETDSAALLRAVENFSSSYERDYGKGKKATTVNRTSRTEQPPAPVYSQHISPVH